VESSRKPIAVIGDVNIFFDTGRFDGYCVYLESRKGLNAPSDVMYFSRLQQLDEKYDTIYDDFVEIYDLTTKVISPEVLKLIEEIAGSYPQDYREIQIWLTVIYAGMVAEENKQGTILGKRIKRLGMYQMLVNSDNPYTAANFSRGKKWKELDELMTKYGF
jgi:hypothetical protein